MIRKSRLEDIDSIMKIIEDGSKFLKSMKVNQWQDGYPAREDILVDIRDGISYVLVDEDRIVATMALVYGVDKTYNYIEGGEWMYEDDYSTVHRLAVDNEFKGRGYGEKMFDFARALSSENGIKYMRIDTHQHNIPMQKLIKKSGYDYRGVIYLANGDKRSAYELKI